MKILALVVALAVAAPSVALAGPTAAQVQARVDAAAKVYASAVAEYKAGTGTVDQVAEWSARWLTSVRETPVKGAKLKAAFAEHVVRMKELETTVTDAVGKGAMPAQDKDTAAYYLAEAEFWFARGK